MFLENLFSSSTIVQRAQVYIIKHSSLMKNQNQLLCITEKLKKQKRPEFIFSPKSFMLVLLVSSLKERFLPLEEGWEDPDFS